ncbi:MAG: ATP-binding protein [Bacteroidales bacterium]|jgi:MinD superfamily P-loop ATPase|nr:ATP-binding protein [Bacteroidales bacterium]
MKEIVVISGKGGTGKTSVTASFAILGGEDVVVADCDVDAADMHLLMQPDFAETEDFYSGVVAQINPEKCTQCGLCADKCRFDAIPVINNQHVVKKLDCEGCGYCARVCPFEAISMLDQNVGNWYVSTTRVNNRMVHAKLGIGAENSGKLVAKVKNEAKVLAESLSKEFTVIDGSPGVGCPVVSSLSGADFTVIVTEPSVSGYHDLKRVYELVKKFKIKAGCIINKYDINPEITGKIEKFLEQEEIEYIASLPYDENFTRAMTQGKTIVEYDEGVLKEKILTSWEKVKELVNHKNEQ